MSEKKVRMYNLKNGNAVGVESVKGGVIIVAQSMEGNKRVTTEIQFTDEAAMMIADLIIERHNEQAVRRMNDLANVMKNAFGGQFAGVEVEFIGIPDMPCSHGFHVGACGKEITNEPLSNVCYPTKKDKAKCRK